MISGKLKKRQIESLGPGRHGDGNGLYLVVDPSGARRWIVRMTVKGQKNREGKPLRTDLGLGGAVEVPLEEARSKAIEYRRMARQGLNPRYSAPTAVPTFEEMARQVHTEPLPTWRNAKHGDQWLNTLRDYAFPKIGQRPVSDIGQPEVLSCLSPIWTEKPETARRLAQRIKAVLDVARSKGFREGENPVTAIRDARVLPKVPKKVEHHGAMAWQDVPAFYAALGGKSAVAARALQFLILAGVRTSEALEAKWEEFDFEANVWTVPAERMKGGVEHRVPLTEAMLAILEPMKALKSVYVFEGQKRNKPLSNMSMLMLLRRMKVEGVTVHGFRSSLHIWASEVAHAPSDLAEMCLAHRVGSEVEQAYHRTDLLERRRALMEAWSRFLENKGREVTYLHQKK